VLAIAAGVGLVLLLTSGRVGYFNDELYFLIAGNHLTGDTPIRGRWYRAWLARWIPFSPVRSSGNGCSTRRTTAVVAEWYWDASAIDR
jgi:hypothetical protein